VLAIPQKRCDRDIVSFLDPTEIEALIAEPDRTTWIGRRDHALLAFVVQTGLRVSEFTTVRVEDLAFGPTAYVCCRGKGRKQRCTPITRKTVAGMRGLAEWLQPRHPALKVVHVPAGDAFTYV
jgi:site-specific recombinase XerD